MCRRIRWASIPGCARGVWAQGASWDCRVPRPGALLGHPGGQSGAQCRRQGPSPGGGQLGWCRFTGALGQRGAQGWPRCTLHPSPMSQGRGQGRLGLSARALAEHTAWVRVTHPSPITRMTVWYLNVSVFHF